MLKFKSKLAKGSLLKKKQTADIIEKIVIEFKEEFKNLNLDTLKKPAPLSISGLMTIPFPE